MPEIPDAKKKRAIKIVDILHNEYPEAKCHLDFKNPFQLLISTILAAQCTDILVNKVMGELYKKYKSPADLAKAKQPVLEKELSRITFFRNKTKNVLNCSKMLVDNFKGKIPQTMDELTSLPGVGRKTANVIMGNCFGKQAIMTDTHVIRVSQRLGFTENENGDKVEADLVQIIPEDKQTLYSLVISEHGRLICNARKPKCPECVVSQLCPSIKIFYPK
jgi:endonuclease-3